jgi:hypothetical protein
LNRNVFDVHDYQPFTVGAWGTWRGVLIEVFGTA